MATKKKTPKTAPPLKKKPEKKKKPGGTTSTADQQRAEDEARARALEEEYYADGSLGRIATPTAVSTVSTEMGGGAQSIAQAEDFYNKAQQKDQYIEAALQRGLSSLEGFDAAENQALKSSAIRDIRADSASSQRNLRQSYGEAGVSGMAAARGLRRDRLATERKVGSALTDLATSNINAKQAALNAFSSQAQGAYGAYQTAQGNALGTLLGARKDVADYRLGAEKTNAEIQAGNVTRGVATDQYNLDQAAAERAGRIGTRFGSMGVDEARRNTEEQNKLAREYMRIARGGR